MRNSRVRAASLCALLAAAAAGAAALVPTPAPTSAAEKMKPEEVVAKHLDSIAAADKRAASRTRVALGSSAYEVRSGGRGQAAGNVVVASDGNKVLLSALFNTPDYPYERVGFDGSKVTVRHLAPGIRSPLGEFFMSYDEIAKEGLLGGTLSTAWPLLNFAERNPKLEYQGTEKVQGREAHKLRYSPRKGSDLKIRLFFDAETFRHVRTDYERTVAATMGDRPIASASRIESRYRLVEDFSDFKDVNGFMLPHAYSIQFSVSGQSASRLLELKFKLTEIGFDQQINAKEFDTDN